MGWPLVPLRKVAKQVQRPETPQPGTTYKRIGVRLWGRGAYLRDAIDGSATKYPELYRVQKDDIVVNKIWARNGSVAVVTDDLDCSFGSSEFPTYEVDKNALLPEWLFWFAKTPGLWRQCDSLSRGTSGQNRLRPERFLDVLLPLPPPDRQRCIISRLNEVAALVEERRRTISLVERENQALLSKAFREVIRGAPSRPMSKVAPLVRRPVDVDPDRSYPELGVRSFGRGTFHKPALSGTEVGSKRLFRIWGGDLLFNIVFAWEGAVAIAQSEDDQRVGSHRFLTCVPNPRLVTGEFLHYYFLTFEGLQKLGDASPGGAGRNRTLGLKKLATIEVPVPCMSNQSWFNRIRRQVRQVELMHTSATQETDSVIPVLLHRAFDPV